MEKAQIRNNTAEFLIFTSQTGENSIEVMVVDENSTCRKFRRVANNSKEYNINFYNLEAVIAVGFRTNSERTIVFRQWAASVLKDFSIRGYVMDKERLKNDFDRLLKESEKGN